jgi:hypothetical protein
MHLPYGPIMPRLLPLAGNPRWAMSLLAAICSFLCLATDVFSAPVSFGNQVMAVLSKARCNQGVCHGNQNGKNGFRLSLRGEDPAFDFASLTRDTSARRTDRFRPAASLILLKATASIPHEGGKRFAVHSPEYDLLANWIGAGLARDRTDTPVLRRLSVTPTEAVVIDPKDHVQLHARALFSDGTERDVTGLAVYEPSNPIVDVSPDGLVKRRQMGETTILVRYLDRQATVQLAWIPAHPGYCWRQVPEAGFIDHLVFARLRTLHLLPSNICSDSVFLRRAYLDILGALPSAEEALAFLHDPDPDKRAHLIDRLLERPEFADFWALKWSDLLRSEEKTLDRKGVHVFHDWIRQAIAEGKPLNEFARAIIGSSGSTYSNPPANFYRALRDPLTRAEAAAQVFLGVRLQCARCHNHPFDRWTQNDYYGLAAFFTRVQYKIIDNQRSDKLDSHEFAGDQVVYEARRGEMRHPRTGQVVLPALPGLPALDSEPEAGRLQALADWVARPDNPFFARTQVNRIWNQLFGRGIVDPEDDFRISNPPANGPLLEALAQEFVAHRFDLRHMVRTIMTSNTYQLSAQPNEYNQDDEANFAHALVRPLQAEQLLDALAQVCGTSTRFPGYPAEMHAVQLPGIPTAAKTRRRVSNNDELFLQRFGKPERLLSCACERSDDSTLAQALQLIAGATINEMLRTPDNRIGKWMDQGKGDHEIVETFYLAALSRLPTTDEINRVEQFLKKSPNRRRALEDFVWGLVNAKEFLLRQ